MTHIVTAPKLTTTNTAGRMVFLNEGDQVPDDLPRVEYSRLLEAGLIGEGVTAADAKGSSKRSRPTYEAE